ncbi:hypothetical protein AB0D86_29605 [Streptomyces sp. NPDC048324]|uniref:hypothetical protein n=1 Tax=Streptomyces sp. NPDC048324 TaxID=3157205 RepID=UPI0034136DDD
MSPELASATGRKRTSVASAIALLLLAAALVGCDNSTTTKTSATSGALRAAASGCPKTGGGSATPPGRVVSPARLGQLIRLDKAIVPGRRPARFDVTVTNPAPRSTRRASLAFTISGPQKIPTFSGRLEIHYRHRWCEIATRMQNESEDSPSLSAAIPLTLDPRSSTVLHFRLSGSRPTPGSHFEDVVGYTVEVNLLATKDVRGHHLHFDLAPDTPTSPTLRTASPS